MKLHIVALSILLFSSNCIMDNEKTFDLNQLKINGATINQLNKETIVSKFGTPKKIEVDTNEFTGELFTLYFFEGISFEVSEQNIISLNEIDSSNVKVNYKGMDISVGSNAKNLKKEFPNNFKNVMSNQVDVLITKTNASYIQFLIKNDLVKVISFREDY